MMTQKTRASALSHPKPKKNLRRTPPRQAQRSAQERSARRKRPRRGSGAPGPRGGWGPSRHRPAPAPAARSASGTRLETAWVEGLEHVGSETRAKTRAKPKGNPEGNAREIQRSQEKNVEKKWGKLEVSGIRADLWPPLDLLLGFGKSKVGLPSP